VGLLAQMPPRHSLIPSFQGLGYLTTIRSLGICPNEPHPRCTANLDTTPSIVSTSYWRSERHVDIRLTLEHDEVTPYRDHVRMTTPPYSIIVVNLSLSVFPRITLPPFSLPPSGIHKTLERHLASSEPRSDYGATEIGSANMGPSLKQRH